MASLDMKGPYPYNKSTIEKEVYPNRIGNYALGYIDSGNIFRVQYVGRSIDMGVRERLLSHIESGDNEYESFKYSYAKSEKEAFEKECKNYHDFGENKKLKNDIHPSRINNYRCPICDN
ncbi:MAG: hypothetical protein E7203_02730 [Selenomonas ruminantium]|jgi:hypothetical protein|uniref:GIY-YIG domain-containing protein n=1 Tax=Selenomonas ruminantium TaxID=971 RepID=A0A927WKC9_SELRU|nr:hypothetical protein [Selenomonas ruminantium]MBE6084378.1 hypothetical protein [Selenomonas ruminantium]